MDTFHAVFILKINVMNEIKIKNRQRYNTELPKSCFLRNTFFEIYSQILIVEWVIGESYFSLLV